MKKIIAVTLALAFGHISAKAESPPQVKAIVAAATSSGLLGPRDFSTTTLSADELSKLNSEIKKLDWVTQIPGLKSTLLANFPAEIGIHQGSGFRIAVYYSGEKIVLLSCSVPLVNGGEKEQKQMIETMLTATETLVGHDSGVRAWLDAEWRRSWEISAKLFDKQPVDQKEIIRKKEFGPYLITVWGVVPDIVFLNCVRRANQAPEPTAASGRGCYEKSIVKREARGGC